MYTDTLYLMEVSSPRITLIKFETMNWTLSQTEAVFSSSDTDTVPLVNTTVTSLAFVCWQLHTINTQSCTSSKSPPFPPQGNSTQAPCTHKPRVEKRAKWKRTMIIYRSTYTIQTRQKPEYEALSEFFSLCKEYKWQEWSRAICIYHLLETHHYLNCPNS